MNKQAMRDVAFEIISKRKKPLEFSKLYSDVTSELGYDQHEIDDKIGYFYTQLTLDGRFVNLGDNTWDLRNNQKFEKVHIDMKDAYTELESELLDPEDDDLDDEFSELSIDEDDERDIEEDDADIGGDATGELF
jgi:DNA-directed RNA polymerase subunit delta